MKKLLFAVLAILILATGCISLVSIDEETVNQPPIAYIDAISPNEILVGGTVSFKGHATDSDGMVVAYKWRSSIDGEISASAEFDTSSLSAGTHAVYLKVQDNSGAWSNEIYRHVRVISTKVTKPVVNSFEASPGSIVRGGTSTLSWDVDGATMVSIDPRIGNVGHKGTREVFPDMTTQYTLTASNEAGSVTINVDVVVAPEGLLTIGLYSIAEEDGNAKKNGDTGGEPDVGDTGASTCCPVNTAIQAFLSFDISGIPDGAIISFASLDLTAADIHGFPFSNLGVMGIYNHQYGVLDGNDFVIGPSLWPLYTTAKMPSDPFSSSALINSIQELVDADNSRFQVRVEFQGYTTGNRIADYLALGSGKPKLVIGYELEP